MARQRIPQIGLTCTAAALAAALSACGQGATNAQPEPSSSTAPSTSSSTSLTSTTPSASTAASPVAASSGAAGDNPAAAGLCKAADLKLSLGHGDAAAGTVYRPLVFTNVSEHSCVIRGFPGVSYVGGADGHEIGAPAYRDGTAGAAITLGKGGTAYATVGFVNVQNYDPATCQPQQVRGLRVYPPQETASMYIDLPTTGCGNDKIPGNQLTVKTIEKGSGES